MSARMLAASAFAVLCAFATSPATAADIYDDDGPRQAESPYSDPRYGDIYGAPRRPRYAAPAPRSYQPPPPYARQRPDAQDEEPRQFEGPPRVADQRDRYGDNGSSCIPRHAIRRRLADAGWGDFHDLELRDRVALVRARRHDGRLYELKVDRCTGEVVRARRSEEPADTFASRQRYEDRRY